MKRNTHSYKTTDTVYDTAMKRADKEKKKLSNVIEDFVSLYASGAVSFKFIKIGLPKQSPKARKSAKN